MIDVRLKYASFDKWHIENNIAVIGKAFYQDNLLHKNAFIQHFSDVDTDEVFVEKLSQLSGHFAVLIQKDNLVFFAVDYLRTIPLFYFIKEEVCLLTDRINEHIHWNENAELFFSKIYCTSENETLLKDWKQLQAGEYGRVEFQDNKHTIKTAFYYTHQSTSSKSFDKNNLQKLENKIVQQIQKLSEHNTIIVPLSGGYDSRYLLALLKKNKIENVYTFTYGRKQSYEVTYARNIAEKLNYKWHFVEYSDDLMGLFLEEDWMRYAENNHHYTSLPHEQDFFALHFLKNENLLPKKGIVINGFCQDLHAGSIFEPDRRFDATAFVKQKYDISTHALSSTKNDRNAYQDWFVRNRVSKFILNSVHVYAHFGFDFYLPFWDKDWIQFWYDLPIKERMGQKIYDDYIFEEYFKPLGIDFKKPSFDATLSLHSVKKAVKKLLPESIVRAWQQQHQLSKELDVNNTHFLYEKIYKKLKHKPPQKNYKINDIHALYLLENLKENV